MTGLLPLLFSLVGINLVGDIPSACGNELFLGQVSFLHANGDLQQIVAALALKDVFKQLPALDLRGSISRHFVGLCLIPQ